MWDKIKTKNEGRSSVSSRGCSAFWSLRVAVGLDIDPPKQHYKLKIDAGMQRTSPIAKYVSSGSQPGISSILRLLSEKRPGDF